VAANGERNSPIYRVFCAEPAAHVSVTLLPVCCPRSDQARLMRQRQTSICSAKGETGATGLEPATSGVTGRADGHNPRRPDTS
jgi:hypothetical protein